MESLKNYYCIAYGGASNACPPGHTMESLRKAVEMGAGMLYVELRATRDQEMVVWPSMQRFIGEDAVYLSDRTLNEWRRITEFDPAPVVSLDDLLDLVAQTRCGLTLDVRVPGLENRLARKLRNTGISYDSLLVTSANENFRTVLRSMDPKIHIAHRFNMDHQAKIDAEMLLKLDTDAVIWPAAILTPKVTQTLKTMGVTVYAGIVNLAQEMRRLRDECGVDGIVTPYPDLLISLTTGHTPGQVRAA